MNVFKVVLNFYDETNDLINAMKDDVEVSSNDYTAIFRILERLSALLDQLCSWGDVMDLENDMETEKDRFEVQKLVMKGKKNMDETLERLIKIGRTWKFEDYRCIDLMKRMTEFFVEAKEGLNAESE